MIDTLLSALADRHRRALLDALRRQPRAVGELAEELGVSQPTVSKHLRVLREAGLVRVTKRAQHRIYAVVPEALAELDGWLAPYRALWNDRLDALGEHLDRTARERAPDSAEPPTERERD
ncbi:ArsR/SmtB family transcription factor [Streptomyces sp. NPDC048172]|uniref:ArsR/SmtB family transcription factor n=1 Tax=Streptomyces sp. NPDC048172 TaxID=3365505 RepID=UPI00371C1E40